MQLQGVRKPRGREEGTTLLAGVSVLQESPREEGTTLLAGVSAARKPEGGRKELLCGCQWCNLCDDDACRVLAVQSFSPNK